MADSFRFDEHQDSFQTSFAADSNNNFAEIVDNFQFDEHQDSFQASSETESNSIFAEIAKGDPGKGLEFSGLVADVSELPEDVELYTMYLVGTEDPYTIYMLDSTGWVDLGTYQGPKGDAGVTPNFKIGSVITINPGAQAHATITGTAENPVLNLYIPRGNPGATGATPAFRIGLVTTGNPGTSAQASITGTAEAPVLNLTIPRGNIGATPDFKIGVVITGSPGTPASAYIDGTPEEPHLNLTLPKGDNGDDYNLTQEDKEEIAGIVSEEVLNAVYPVGSIYMSVNNTSPATLFGGSWDRITGRFLLAATDGGNSGASQAAGNTGGSANAVVVSHSHGMNSGGAHKHTITTYYVKDAASGTAKNRTAGGQDNTATNISKILSDSGSHTHTINSEGVSGTGANMPPYLSVYMWKRIA